MGVTERETIAQAGTPAAIVLLTGSHGVADFDCGDPPRNDWLRTRAFARQRNDNTRTYVAAEDERVLGFYALSVGAVVRAGLPGPLRRSSPDPVSCVLLAQLAVALGHQGQGLSRGLILHAMQQTVRIAEIAGCLLFAVHPARPELAGYYAKAGFIAVDTTPALMVMTMPTVRATLAAVAAVADQA